MRRIRLFSVLFFAAACAVCLLYHLYDGTKENNHAPQITMDQQTVTVSVQDQESALLAGVTASDKEDGDVTDSLFIEKYTNFIADGTRDFTIVAVDSEGSVSKVTREVVYSDYTSPRFTLSAPLLFPVRTTDITDSLGATDVLDGDLSDRVKVTGQYTMSSTAGDYPMEFTVTNSAGDVSRLTATVTLYNQADESRIPQIELTDYLIYLDKGTKIKPKSYLKSITCRYTTYENGGDGYFYEETMSDETEDRDVIPVSAVKIDSAVDYNTAGTYEITYSYTEDDYEGTVRLIVVVQ